MEKFKQAQEARSQRCVFLDRDGTINVEKNYLYRIEDFELLPGVVEGLRMLQAAGFMLVIITNQSGIARGFYSEDDLKCLNDWMFLKLSEFGVMLSGIYYCPHLPDAPVSKYRMVCNCRKPSLGLFKKACEELDIDINCSYAIGDRLRDCSVCKVTEAKGYLIGNTEDDTVIDSVRCGVYPRIRYAQNLYYAALDIVGNEGLRNE